MSASPDGHPHGLRLKTVEVERVAPPRQQAIDQDFHAAKRQFFRGLARQRQAELRQGGLTWPQISRMLRGASPQVGEREWVVHHVIPRRVSARMSQPNATDNLCLMHQSTHQLLHEYIDPQIANLEPGQSQLINLPNPAGPFYSESAIEAGEQLARAEAEPPPPQPGKPVFPSVLQWAKQFVAGKNKGIRREKRQSPALGS